MKKNKMMRIASALLIAVLLTTSIISGTFAKYVTRGEVEDQARVAKFGVQILGSGSLFDVTYLAKEDNTPGSEDATGSADDYDEGKDNSDNAIILTVESFNGDNLVAPGTRNDEGLTISVTGRPEVDVRVEFDFKAISDVFLHDASWPDMTTSKNGDSFLFEEFDDVNFNLDYYPIVYTLAGQYIADHSDDIESALDDIYEIDPYFLYETGTNFVQGNLAAIEYVFNSIFNSESDDYDGIYVDANTNLAEVIGTFTLTWEWPFEDNFTDAEDIYATIKGKEYKVEDTSIYKEAKDNANEEIGNVVDAIVAYLNDRYDDTQVWDTEDILNADYNRVNALKYQKYLEALASLGLDATTVDNYVSGLDDADAVSKEDFKGEYADELEKYAEDAGVAAVNALRDKKDTMLGDLAALANTDLTDVDSDFQGEEEGVDDIYDDREAIDHAGSFSLTTSAKLSITVTQVD